MNKAVATALCRQIRSSKVQYWVKCSVLASVMLSGCSLFQSEPQQSAEQSRMQSLTVPVGLQQPRQPGEFDIPPTTATGQADNRSPVLVLATAASSRVEEGERQSRVWFDRTEATGDLVPFLQQVLQAQFTVQGVELTPQDEQALVYHTGWISRTNETGFWFWKASETTEQARFEIRIEPKSHGRSASLLVSMLEHQYFTQTASLGNNDVKRQEVALLNQVIDRVGKEEIVFAIANKNKAPDVSLEPGMDADGNPALLTTQTLDVTWSQLEALFGELDLTVTDRNRSAYTYYLNYEKSEPGLWSKLWGSNDKPVLPVAAGEYQLVLSRSSNLTALSLRDKDGAQLDAETVLALHQPFVQAIRLAQIDL